jgi:hypothetical protein
MIFEVPECAILEGYTPNEGSSLTAEGDIKWTSSIGSGKSETYTISYTGEVLTGMVDATIQATGSGEIQTELIPGPCKGVYSISGTVYVDEDSSGTRNKGEAGIENVTVDLIDDDKTTAGSVKTLTDGSYLFNVYTGDLSVNFDINILPGSNGFLYDGDNFIPTTVLPIDVPLDGGDVSGKDVGFAPQTSKIIEKFELGQILLKTETPSFWSDEFKFSTKGKSTFFTKSVLLGFLTEIENLGLTYGFQFGSIDNDRLAFAENVLSLNKKSTELEVLRAELLAAMLNVVSGNGAFDQQNPQTRLEEFNTLILKSGAAAAVALEESLSANSVLMMNSTTSNYETTTFTGTASLNGSGGLLLTSFNGGGGSIED